MTTEIKQTNNKKEGKEKRKFKIPSSLTIIIGVVIFVAILTWIPHGGSLSVQQTRILDNYISKGFTDLKGTFTDSGITINVSYTFAPGQNLADLLEGNGLQMNSAPAPEGAGSQIANQIINNLGLSGSIEGDKFVTSIDMPPTLSGFSNGESSQFGLFDTVKAMIGGYWQAFGVGLYLVGIFAVVELLMRTETLKAGVSSLVKGLNGKEIILLPTLFLLFALGGTLFGMQEETLGLLPIIVPVIVLAGFDAPAGMLVVVLGTTSGIASSVLDPFSVGVMATGLGDKISTGLIQRMIMFTVLVSIGMSFVTWYGLRVKKNQEKSLEKDKLEENKIWATKTIGSIDKLEQMTGKQKWALGIFAMVFGWMVFTLMPWIEWFPTLEANAGWKFFSSIFFGHVLIGQWYFIELSIMFFLGAIIIASIFNYNTKETANVFFTSLKEMFGVITIIAFSRATSMILTTSGLTYGMIYGIADPDKLTNLNPIEFMIIWFPIFLLMATFIPSTSGLAGITAPIIGGVANASGADHTQLTIAILLVYPLAQGVINMFSPTTGLVVVQAEQSKVSFSKAMPWLATYATVIAVVGLITSTLIVAISGAI